MRHCPLDDAGPDALVLELPTTSDDTDENKKFTAIATTTTATTTTTTSTHNLNGGVTVTRHHHASRVVAPGQEGLYVLLYCGCPAAPTADEGVEVDIEGGGSGEGRHISSFRLRVAFWNEGIGDARNYLSAGSEPLPTLFFGMFLLFLVALGVWIQCIRRHPKQVSGGTFIKSLPMVNENHSE